MCSHNWIHHNTIRTYGNECVEVKEGSEYTLVEYNVCEQQRDRNSGCLGFRGSHNTARYNEISTCAGAGVRVGGDEAGGVEFGLENNIYNNEISNTGNGAFSVMDEPQGVLCGNTIVDTTSVSTL